MSTPQSNEFGFKRISLENWLTVDPAWAYMVMPSSRPDPSEAWVSDIIETKLNSSVPLPIRKLFEIARGTLVYSLMFYPLLTLGTEQLYRVFEAAASAKCKAMNAPYGKVRVFAQKVQWLVENGAISVTDHARWRAFVQLRNVASHPTDQNIYPPGLALSMLDSITELIDALFLKP